MVMVIMAVVIMMMATDSTNRDSRDDHHPSCFLVGVGSMIPKTMCVCWW